MEYRLRILKNILSSLVVIAVSLVGDTGHATLDQIRQSHDPADRILGRAPRPTLPPLDLPGTEAKPRRPAIDPGEQFVVLDGKETRRGGFVGLLLREAPGGRVALGSGSLVCPNVVLTVAHVALKRDDTMTFTLGKDALKHARRGEADRKVVDQFSLSKTPGEKDKLTDAEAALDIALVKLDPPFPPEYEPAKIANSLPNPKNRNFTIIGMGQNEKGKGAGIKREGDIIANTMVKQNDRAVLIHERGAKGQLPMPGDSGAPIFQTGRNGELGPIMGVNSTGNSRDTSTTALIAPVRAQLVRKLREWCPGGFEDI